MKLSAVFKLWAMLVYVDNVRLVEGHCTYGSRLNAEYLLASDILRDETLSSSLSETLSNCTFGKIHYFGPTMFFSLCLQHCSLRDNCVAVYAGNASCQFCLKVENMTQTIDQLDFSRIYVNRTNIYGRFNF